MKKMNVTVPHEVIMLKHHSLEGAIGLPSTQPNNTSPVWANGDLSEQEMHNLALIDAFWKCWKSEPFDASSLGSFFAPDVTVRTGWRGEHVIQGREAALALYTEEAKRQVEHGEVSDFQFPVVIAKGPIVFHTWIWTARSDQLDYHIERPMAAFYLLKDNLIERWDSYCTGPESEPDYVGGNGPDGL